MLAGPAFVVMLLVTAYPILQAVYYSLFNYRLTDPDNRSFIGLSNYGVILTDPLWWQALGVTLFITVVTVAVELVLGFALAMVMAKALKSLRPVLRAVDPHPVRRHHRRVGVRLAVRLRHRHRVRQPLVRLAARHQRRHRLVRRPVELAGRHLPGRDLEDDAVHLAAAARRPRPGARRAAGGGEGRRRHLVAAAVEGDHPEHEGGDHGRRCCSARSTPSGSSTASSS